MKTKAKVKHTPTPWIVGLTHEKDGTIYYNVDSGDRRKGGRFVAATLLPEDREFIVRAVNAHEELLDMVYRAIPYIGEAIKDPANKPESVRQLLRQMHAVIQKADPRS